MKQTKQAKKLIKIMATVEIILFVLATVLLWQVNWKMFVGVFLFVFAYEIQLAIKDVKEFGI